MEFQGITGNFSEANVEALAVAVFKGDKPTTGPLKELDKLTGGRDSGGFQVRGIQRRQRADRPAPVRSERKS